MTPTYLTGTGHSTIVHMHLRVNGQVLSIGQLGPDFIMLDQPADHAPGEAEITMSIDGRERRWHVLLPDGIRADDLQTRISSCGREKGPA